ncbi:hypothetical protein [Corynebacterium lactis]|uniref:hypothetical protein n=1 Tax=Corynebacterium lactis TaxID=1231000 RepID=UPI000ACFD89B|nr:hypothetical protein [Corynebacterium lactis]
MHWDRGFGIRTAAAVVSVGAALSVSSCGITGSVMFGAVIAGLNEVPIAEGAEEGPGASPPLADAGTDPGTDPFGNGVGDQERRRIFRDSENWKHLESPIGVIPGGQYFVHHARGHVSTCSFGWLVRSREDAGRLYNLTAGHCGKPGDEVFVEAGPEKLLKVGTFIWTEHDEFAPAGTGPDQALIELEDSAFAVGTPELDKVTLVGHASMDWLQQNRPYLCRLGWRSGLSCGSFDRIVNQHLFRYDNISDKGDSGGVIWAQDPEDENRIWAVGVTSFIQPSDAASAGGASIGGTMQRFNLAVVQ